MSSKKAVIIIVIIGIICFGIGFFVAKTQKEKEPSTEVSSTITESVSQTEEVTSSETQSETTEESTTETTEEATTEAPAQSKTVNTDYFSVVTPESWDGKYSYNIRKYNSNGAYGLTFTHNASVDEGNGGLVFVIEVHPVSESYPEMMANSPMPFKHMGVISVEDSGDYDVIVTYPSDVQYSDNTEEGYLQLKNSVDSVLESLQVAEGAEYTAK